MRCDDMLCGRTDSVIYVTLRGGIVLCGKCFTEWTTSKLGNPRSEGILRGESERLVKVISGQQEIKAT